MDPSPPPRFGFRDTCDCTTLFILNLAFSDLLYCTFNLPLYAVQYLLHEWPFSERMCYAFAAFRFINAYADWLSLAFIAVSRCAGLIWNEAAERYLSGRNGFAIVVLIWAYSIGLNSLVFFNVIGDFGYNCRSGKCDYIETPEDPVNPQQFYFGIGFSIPCVVIIVCYLTIWCYVKHSTTYLKKVT